MSNALNRTFVYLSFNWLSLVAYNYFPHLIVLTLELPSMMYKEMLLVETVTDEHFEAYSLISFIWNVKDLIVSPCLF